MQLRRALYDGIGFFFFFGHPFMSIFLFCIRKKPDVSWLRCITDLRISYYRLAKWILGDRLLKRNPIGRSYRTQRPKA